MRSIGMISAQNVENTKTFYKKPTIVVADDDLAILDVMTIILEMYNFNVVTVNDGMVVPKLMSVQPNLLLLDVCMSGVDGRDICKAIKEIDAIKDIPVIMISAGIDLLKATEESGADDYLAKPFEMQDLIAKVNKYVLN